MSSRRDWMGSLGAVAVGGLAAGSFGPRFNEALGVDDANNPAANVGDRTTAIKITKLTATPMQRKVFLKLETNHGVTGWGEIDQLDPNVAAMLVRSIFERDDEKPGTIGAMSTPTLMPASASSRTARSRCMGCAVPGSSARQASSSTVGTLMWTTEGVARCSAASTSLSRTIIGPLVTSPAGVRARVNASMVPRVSRYCPSMG